MDREYNVTPGWGDALIALLGLGLIAAGVFMWRNAEPWSIQFRRMSEWIYGERIAAAINRPVTVKLAAGAIILVGLLTMVLAVPAALAHFF